MERENERIYEALKAQKSSIDFGKIKKKHEREEKIRATLSRFPVITDNKDTAKIGFNKLMVDSLALQQDIKARKTNARNRTSNKSAFEISTSLW